MTVRQKVSFVLLIALNAYIGTQIAAASVTRIDWWQGILAIGIVGLLALDLLLVFRILDEDG